MIHPMVLGSGRRLFPDGPPADLTLVDTKTSPPGVTLATYDAAYPNEPDNARSVAASTSFGTTAGPAPE